jgi:hypothetical protein
MTFFFRSFVPGTIARRFWHSKKKARVFARSGFLCDNYGSGENELVQGRHLNPENELLLE